MAKASKCLTRLAVILLCGQIMACTARLETGALEPAPNPVQGSLAMEKRADNMEEGIGYGSFTVFAIPVMQIKVEGDGKQELMRVVKETVEHVGYKVTVVDQPAKAGAPVIAVRVNKFFFYNYTWFFPLVFNAGKIDLTMTVSRPDGTELWSKEYQGRGSGFYDFNPTVNMALNNILNQMVVDLASPEFREAVFGTPPTSRRQPEDVKVSRR